MVLEGGQFLRAALRVPEHAAVPGHEGHPGGHHGAERIGFCIEASRAWSRQPRERLRREPGLVDQVPLDPLNHTAADVPRDERQRHAQRHGRRDEGREEGPRAERHRVPRSPPSPSL